MMGPGYPTWFFQFMDVLEASVNVLMIVLGLLIVRVVSQPRWRHHLRWAVPATVAPALILLGRLPLPLIPGGPMVVQTATLANVLTVTLYALASLTSLYATWALWQMLRDLAGRSASPDPLARHQPQPGVWPPPPTINT